MNDEWPWVCEDCGDHVDQGKSLCGDCAERRHDEWREHQDRLRMSEREAEDEIHWASW